MGSFFCKVKHAMTMTIFGVGDYLNDNKDNAASEPADELLEEAIAHVIQEQRVSISMLQRKLRVNYNRGARLIEAMEVMGVVTAPNEKGVRTIVAKH